MKRLILIAIALFSSSAMAQSLSCDGAIAQVTYGAKGPYGYESVQLVVKRAAASVQRQYEFVWFSLACQAAPSGKHHLVYQVYCGGSGCRDLDNWGIIDPVTLKFLLEPDDHNRSKAMAIMGPKLKPLK